MRALIVYPEVEDDTYWSFRHILPWLGKRSPLIPLGPITVAASLPKGYDVRVVDMNVQTLEDADIHWADIVLTSSAVVQRDTHQDLVERVRSIGRSVIAGGPYPTQFFDEVDADYLVLGEVESGVLQEFLFDFRAGRADRIYARPVLDRRRAAERTMDERQLERLVEMEGARITVDEERPSLASSPIPRFDLLDLNQYVSAAIQTTRGCPHICNFCSEPALWGHRMRVKDPGQVVDELRAVRATGYQGTLFIVDDNFVGNRKEIKPVLDAIGRYQEEHGYPFQLYTEADILLATDDDLLARMRDAGFTMAFIGLETPDEHVLREMGKGQNVAIDLVTAVRKIQRHGMEVSAGLIVGTDADPPDINDRIVDFCAETGIPLAMAGLLTVARGSELYEGFKRAGRLREESTGNNLDATLNFVPKRACDRAAPDAPSEALIGEESARIVAGYKELLSRLYDGEAYFARCATLRDNLGPRPKSSRRLGRSEVRAFANSMLRQLVGKPYSANYRSFLCRTLRDRPEFFPEAVSYGVKFHHFEQVTRRIVNS